MYKLTDFVVPLVGLESYCKRRNKRLRNVSDQRTWTKEYLKSGLGYLPVMVFQVVIYGQIVPALIFEGLEKLAQ